VFFALWPDDAVRATLAAAADEVQTHTGGRAIVPGKIHLTLFFIGSIDRARITRLEATAAAIRSSAFELTLDTIGYWWHNGIVWCGTTRCPPALARLAADLRAALEREGFHAEDRPYVPHVTLVRDAARAPRRMSFAPCAWEAREFALVESEPATGGTRYAVRAAWPL
jgi:2'-5' RNA ligase